MLNLSYDELAAAVAGRVVIENGVANIGHLDLSDFKSAAERLSCKLGFS